jgi:hypothetical protein
MLTTVADGYFARKPWMTSSVQMLRMIHVAWMRLLQLDRPPPQREQQGLLHIAQVDVDFFGHDGTPPGCMFLYVSGIH